VFLTGAAGFIGSNLIDRLMAHNIEVIGWDNLSTGNLKFLNCVINNPNFTFVYGDNLDLAGLTSAMKGCDVVIHLAANADIRFGLDHPTKDIEQNILATSNVLESMRVNGIKKIIFSSTGSVYGEAKQIPTPETVSFPIQTSLYAASKLACEGLISAYCEGYGFSANIFRFVSILGERYTHGHVFDFLKQLNQHPNYLDVLGNGKQQKSYLYVGDCINAILSIPIFDKVNIYNLGTEESIELNQSIKTICNYMNLNPEIKYSGGNQGWIGDNPLIHLDISKAKNSGWKPKYSIKYGIENTVKWLSENEWIYEYRK
jgi:UDP-glucose 4-epimerase